MKSAALLLTALAFLSGCATSAPPDQKQAVAAEDYEWVTPLGSNIPVRVKKGEKAAGTSPTGTMTGDQMSQAIRGAGAPTPKGSN